VIPEVNFADHRRREGGAFESPQKTFCHTIDNIIFCIAVSVTARRAVTLTALAFTLKSSNIHEKYEILRYVMIFCYLLIVVVVKCSLVKIQDGGNRKRKWSKSSSLSLLSIRPSVRVRLTVCLFHACSSTLAGC